MNRLRVGLALAGFAAALTAVVLDQARIGWGAIALLSLTWGSTFNLANQLSPLLLVEILGERHFASLFGIGNLISGIGSALGPEVVGYLVDTTHTYNTALVLCAAVMLIALLPIALLRTDPETEKAYEPTDRPAPIQ